MTESEGVTAAETVVIRPTDGVSTVPIDVRRVVALVMTAVAIIAVIATAIRLAFGADFIDEAFYAATALRFARGARPFMDDWDSHQTAAFLVAPYVRLHLFAFGGTTGLMLSLRVLWFVLTGGAVVLAWRALKRFIDARCAALCCVCALCVMPYMIPAPSYNTLGVIFGSIALSLCVLGDAEKRRWMFFASGLALGLAVFAYPSLVLVAVGALGGVFWLTRSKTDTLLMLAGGTIIALAGLVLVVQNSAGVRDVLEITSLQARIYGWGGSGAQQPLDRLIHVLAGAASTVLRSVSFWIAAAIGVLQILKRPVPGSLAVACVVALPLTDGVARFFPGLITVEIAQVALVSALLVLCTAPYGAFGAARRSTVFVLLLGLVASMTFAATSGLGAALFGLGGLMVMPFALGVLTSRIAAAPGSRPARGDARTVALVSLIPLLFALLGTNAAITYRDASPNALTTRVRSGPYAGIRTTARNARDIEGLCATLERVSTSSDRVFVYHGLPAGYLMTDATPASPLLWTVAFDELGLGRGTDMVLERVSAKGELPEVVVKNLAWPDSLTMRYTTKSDFDPARDGVERWVRDNYRLEKAGFAWEVYTLKE